MKNELLTIGPFTVYGYGLMIAIGIVAGCLTAEYRAGKQKLDSEQVGIIIPKSAGMAKFMNNNVAGIHVPDEMIEELKADKEKTKAGITGVEIAARIIKECKPYCQGVHIMALGWESKIPALLEQAEI